MGKESPNEDHHEESFLSDGEADPLEDQGETIEAPGRGIAEDLSDDLPDEDDIEAEYADNILKDIEKHPGSSRSRKTIEQLLEEKRLRKELEDEFDFDDIDDEDE